MLNRHFILELRRNSSIGDYGEVELSEEPVAEYYGLLIPAREWIVPSHQGEGKEITHVLYTRQRKPEVGNIISYGGEKYLVVEVYEGLNGIVEARLECLR